MEESIKYFFAINGQEFQVYTYKRKIQKSGLQFSFAIQNYDVKTASAKIGVGFTLNKLQDSKIFVRNQDGKLINAYLFKSLMKTKNDLVFIFKEHKQF